MARANRSWWKHIVVVSLLSALFVTGALIFGGQKALAAPAYNWVSPTQLSIVDFPSELQVYSNGQANFLANCTDEGNNVFLCVGENKAAYPCVVGRDRAPEFRFEGSASSATLEYFGKAGFSGVQCESKGTRTVTVGQIENAPKGLPASSAEADIQFECGKRFSLNWFLCPLYHMINGIVGQVDNMINSLLYVEQDKIFDNKPGTSGEGYYKAWQTMRSFALALLLIAGLIMVIAQALGFQLLDAYTVKKVMPRLVIAVIAIALSWQLMQFFVVLTNDIGLGVKQIIYFPFQDMPGSLNLDGGSAFVGGLLASGAMLALGAGGLLSFALTAFLAALVAFLVLMIRQLVIIVLILFAPIAIACSILPNTQGAYKLWYESFTKALMMFPIIVAFIAIGRVFAVVAIQGNISNVPAASQLIGFAAYFLPYFLIPMTFSLAGGAMRFIGGQINDRNRGAFDRLKKYRSGKIAHNMEAMKEGRRFSETGIAPKRFLASRFNRASGMVGAIPHGGLNPLTMGRKMQAYQSNQSMLEAAEYAEKGKMFQVIKGNDDFLQAAIHSHGDDGAVRSRLRRLHDDDGRRMYTDDAIEQAVMSIRAARGETSSEVFETAAALALPATGTAFNPRFDRNGVQIGGGAGEMNALINEVAGEDRVKAGRMLAAMRGGASQARRFDLAGGGFGHHIGQLEQQYEHEISGGTRGITEAQASENIVQASLEGQGGQYIAAARAGAVRNFAPAMRRRLDQVLAEGTPQDVNRELAAIAGRYDAMSSTSPENARILADILGQEVNIGGETMTIQKHIEARRNPNDPLYSDAFIEMRREYGAASRAAATALQGQPPGGGVIPPAQAPPQDPAQRGPYG